MDSFGVSETGVRTNLGRHCSYCPSFAEASPYAPWCLNIYQHQLIGLRDKLHKSHISWENPWFPIDFSLSQPIDNICPNKITKFCKYTSTVEQGPGQTWQVPRVPVHPWSAPWGRRPRWRFSVNAFHEPWDFPGGKDTKTGWWFYSD